VGWVLTATKPTTFLSDADWPHECFDFQLPFERHQAALVVVDMQNYCVSPDNDLGRSLRCKDSRLFHEYSERVAKVIDNIEVLLDGFRSRGLLVVFTRHGSLLPDGRDLIARRRSREDISLEASFGQSGHMAAIGSEGHQIIPRLSSRPNELVLDKNTSSAFNSTAIDSYLRNLEISTLVVAGIATDMCVMTTSLDAADRGWNVFIASDACATIDPGMQEAVLLHFRRVFGRTPRTLEILSLLEGQ